jgi:outer membrane immunogenic protein
MKAWRRLGATSAVAVLAGLGFVGTALADGGPRRGKMEECCISWSGLYLGIHAGYGWGETDFTHVLGSFFGAAGASAGSFEPQGALGGVHAGFLFQAGSIVFGPEVALTLGTLADNVRGPNPGFPQDSAYNEVRNLFTAVARLGVVTGGLGGQCCEKLFYVKGGYALGEVGWKAFSGPPGANVPTNWIRNKEDGWTVGAGVEIKGMKGGSLGLEYNFIHLDGDDRFVGFPPGTPVTLAQDDLRIHTVMVRLSQQLNWDRGGPLK